MSALQKPRHPKGTAAGGRFAKTDRPEPDFPVALDATTSLVGSTLTERQELEFANEGTWLGYGFSPEQSTVWQACGFPPHKASLWVRAGFDAHSAQQWRDAGFTPTVAAAANSLGFTPEAAREWEQEFAPLWHPEPEAVVVDLTGDDLARAAQQAPRYDDLIPVADPPATPEEQEANDPAGGVR